MRTWFDKLPWWLLIAGTLTLGLAPFQPVPHLLEKMSMLFHGALHRPIDIFDLILHAVFPVLLITKTIIALRQNLK